jgi:hypothetical protein
LSNNIKILICTHKACELPGNDVYLPIHAGKALSDIDLGIPGDNTGDNISEKNKTYCELTVLYWAWKNIKKLYPDLEYIGLCHYRRFFILDKNLNGSTLFQQNSGIIETVIRNIMRKHQIILPNRATYPYSLKTQYCINHIKSDFELLKDVVKKKTPHYISSFSRVMSETNKVSWCNMFISNFALFDRYCSWLFSILFDLEKQIDLKARDLFQSRVFGFMAERLLNVFTYHHKLFPKYYPVLYLDGLHNGKIQESWKEILRNNLSFFTTKIINKILG